MANPVAHVFVHVVWSTAGRSRVLDPSLDERLEGILRRKATEHGCVIVAFGAAADHVHLILQLGCTCALADVVGPMKGVSAFMLNRLAVLETRVVWQAGYWAESLEPRSVPLACRYALGQRAHHQAARGRERWELPAAPPPRPAGPTRSASRISDR